MPDGLDDNALLERAGQRLKSGNLKDAKRLYKQLISKHPDVAELYINLAVVYRSQNRSTKAAETLRQALELAPENAGGHYNLANVQVDLMRPKAAEISYLKALERDPDFVDASLGLADLLISGNRRPDAKRVLCGALERNPKDARIHNNLGNMCKDEGLLAEAEFHLRQASLSEPENGDYNRNLGAILYAQGNPDTAIDFLNTAIILSPEDADAYCLRAFCRLATKDFRNGWIDYAWRWKSSEQEPLRPFRQKPWDGASLAGKSLLIWGEQGIGDEIMFGSILPDVLKDAARVVLECEPRLVPLMARSFPNIEVVSRQKMPDRRLQSADIDFQLPIASLAQYYRIQAQDFSTSGAFLKCDVGARNDIRQRYLTLANGRRIIGIAWKSGAGRTGSGRSLALSDLAPFSQIKNVFFVNLQYGDVSGDLARLTNDHGVDVYQDPMIDQMKDMDAFAAQIAALDMVVSAANTTVHVAGGLGVPTKVLIPGTADWRWITDRDVSYWYPSVRLHRKSDNQNIDRYIMKISDCINSDINE